MSPRSTAIDTRERILAEAINLALAKGFVAMTLDEVCAAARVTKGAFFYHFKSKEALGQAMLERWVSNGAQAYAKAPFAQEKDPLEQMYGYIDFTIELTKIGPCGCLVGIFSQELWQSHPTLRTQCAESFLGWARGIQQFLEDAKASHTPEIDFDPRSLAYHFVAVFEGALIIARSLNRKEVVEEHLLHFKRYLQGLFAKS